MQKIEVRLQDGNCRCCCCYGPFECAIVSLSLSLAVVRSIDPLNNEILIKIDAAVAAADQDAKSREQASRPNYNADD